MIGKRIKSEYGTRIVGRFDGRLRRDTYISDSDGQPCGDPIFAVDSRDDSPPHDKLSKYDPRCHSCWLNHGHTEQYHSKNVS